ncbi:MAG: hypothetical protein BAJALOKI1v1_270013 [Promethearchaeota archaeon]|nr:MAG: hypothetical protein BAJALOKI1v1_270013 [Candidatus Lokiarchaeota archaeon]
MYSIIKSIQGVKNCELGVVVRNWQNSTIIEDAIKIKIAQTE